MTLITTRARGEKIIFINLPDFTMQIQLNSLPQLDCRYDFLKAYARLLMLPRWQSL